MDEQRERGKGERKEEGERERSRERDRDRVKGERERKEEGRMEGEIDIQLHSEKIVSVCPSVICSFVREQTCPLECW